ncbi:MAG: cell division initiation protein [Fimbriimonadaceae bacterium]|jgi:cell division initiation protein|nr:cell division initiation protein [Fimbriimonadaceae bacterium]
MERLSLIEIETSTLKTSLKGYDRDQVNDLLGKARAEIAGLLSELKSSREEIERQKQIIEALTAQENMVKEALIVAQRTSDEIRGNAHREADAVIAQAHRNAEEAQRQTQSKINDLRWEHERARMDRQRFVTDFRNMLEGYLRGLAEESVPAPTEPSENIRAAIDAQV